MGLNRAHSPLALVAALLLAAVVGSHAQSCVVGSLRLDLVSVTGGGSCSSNVQAVCLPSFTIGITSTGCALTITPGVTATDRVYVDGIWSSNAAGTHARKVQCPTTAASSSPGSTGAVESSIETALESWIYGASSTNTRTLTTTWSATSDTLTVGEGSCNFKYAVTQVVTAVNWGRATAPALAACGSSLTDGTECQSNPTTNPNCPAGRRKVTGLAGDDFACPLCRAGTTSTGSTTTCTECGQGYVQPLVGQTTTTGCTVCGRGTYAAGGNSHCLPCDAGTYQGDTGQGSCDPCPANTFARWPGMSMCLVCESGIPRCAYGYDGGACTPGTLGPSAGYHVLKVDTAGNLKTPFTSVGGTTQPLLFQQCTVDATTQISVFVSAQCVVTLSPITDTACSEPSSGSYTYNNLRVTNLYYVSTTKIASRVITSSTTTTMLALTDTGSASLLDLEYWPVSTNPDQATAVTAGSVYAGTVEVMGGQVATVPTAPITTCPAGSYDASTSPNDYCLPCPVGKICPGGSTVTDCAAGTRGPYMGQSVSSATTCIDCSGATSGWTSTAGSETCSVPYYNEACGNGQEYNPSTGACESCPAGTKRNTATDTTCVACAPGKYSAAGQTDCSSCPQGEYSPDYGLAEQNSAAAGPKCLTCPLGYIAVTSSLDTTPAANSATECKACDAGKYAAIVSPATYYTCETCPVGTFRSGDASPQNNVCTKIPAGYKTDATRSSISLCPRGQVSYWNEAQTVRTPVDTGNGVNDQTCEACTGNRYAPRQGMAACRPCPAGTYPQNNDATAGNEVCTSCGTVSTISYRPFTSTSATCLECTPGKEVYGSNFAACLPCVAGYYMPADGTGTKAAYGACIPCETNKYQPSSGQSSCLTCTAGTSTQSTGNVECQDCPLGYYSPKAASACLPTPRGTYVNTTGATIFSLCPAGTFSNEIGADSCEPCGPGEYSNTAGARTCRSCGAGTFSRAKATTCTKCQRGYTSTSGSGFCSPCKAGTYSDAEGASQCTLCPKGNQCPTVAMSSAQPCRAGYFSNKTGNRLCTPCPPNTVTTTTGQTSCTACDPGKTTRGLSGQSVCQPIRPQVRRLMVR